jgi:glutaredoxin
MTMPISTLCTLALLLAAAGAQAQQVYRQVGPGGRVTFSDQPPAANAQPARPGPDAGAAPSAVNTAGLPYELRQVVQRYPVTIYTGAECAPCDTGRSLLTTRGIPFDERTIKTAQDTEALQRLSGQASLPLLSIGAQQLKGFSDGEWSQYLDAAGYPRSNQLPAGYRMPPAAPLVAQQAAPAAPAEQRAAPAAPAPAPTVQGPTPSNPAGIKF